jgi:hypothetical protein
MHCDFFPQPLLFFPDTFAALIVFRIMHQREKKSNGISCLPLQGKRELTAGKEDAFHYLPPFFA